MPELLHQLIRLYTEQYTDRYNDRSQLEVEMIRSDDIKPFINIVYDKKTGNILLNHRIVSVGDGPITSEKEMEIGLREILNKLRISDMEEIDVIKIGLDDIPSLDGLSVDVKTRKLVSKHNRI